MSATREPALPQRRCGSGCDLFLLITTTLLAIALIELSLRAFEGVAVWEWTDFRKQRAAHLGVNAIARYDPDLGWTEKANWTSSGNGPLASTMRDGIRASGADAFPAKPKDRRSQLGTRSHSAAMWPTTRLGQPSWRAS